MGLSSFALAAFLFVTLDPDYTSSPVYAASSEGVEITYGSVIKLMHERTKVRLHSHDVPYGSGSGQQSVTGFPSVDDSNSYWIVRPELESSAKQGDTIKSGANIRLQHMRTRRWLHSHLHASPISGNLEDAEQSLFLANPNTLEMKDLGTVAREAFVYHESLISVKRRGEELDNSTAKFLDVWYPERWDDDSSDED
ncbi:hypothetical protein RHMOL_Rhmol12G0221300 [Rhododendron molle]|uniref:Uncharacterized protein n=1 Tax=Rhododendron molle TaxID=49168 RepID=A0ACC0LKR0_RHOML|nr:hypothetical protein RHMOL_Rhmol12G0221300 [Rhododendron molle]